MRVGVVILPEFDRATAIGLWRRVEQLGFDHAWTYDHLAWRTLRDSPWYASVPFLATAAMVTTRIRIGFLVASPNFRHPVPFAKEVTTLDDISQGRLMVGLGAGGYGWDATMLGSDPLTLRDRSKRFREFVEIVDGLLREETFSYQGRFFSAVEARNIPRCVQEPRVPLLIAATGDRGMRLAARIGDGWVTTGEGELTGGADLEASVEAVRRQVARLEAACRDVGRDPKTIARFILTGPGLESGTRSRAIFSDAIDRYEDAGVTDMVIHWPRPSEPYAGDVAAWERVVADRGRP